MKASKKRLSVAASDPLKVSSQILIANEYKITQRIVIWFMNDYVKIFSHTFTHANITDYGRIEYLSFQYKERSKVTYFERTFVRERTTRTISNLSECYEERHLSIPHQYLWTVMLSRRCVILEALHVEAILRWKPIASFQVFIRKRSNRYVHLWHSRIE